jgi:hypothetical protein
LAQFSPIWSASATLIVAAASTPAHSNAPVERFMAAEPPAWSA